MIPIASIKDLNAVPDPLQELLIYFWNHGGKEKYEASKEMRGANGIPDKQWFAANLMDIIDSATITYDPDTTKPTDETKVA